MSCPSSLIHSHISWQTTHNAPFCNRNVHTCAHFCCKMMHHGLWEWCILGFVNKINKSTWKSVRISLFCNNSDFTYDDVWNIYNWWNCHSNFNKNHRLTRVNHFRMAKKKPTRNQQTLCTHNNKSTWKTFICKKYIAFTTIHISHTIVYRINLLEYIIIQTLMMKITEWH